MSDAVTWSTDGVVCTVTVSRPETYNALDVDTRGELGATLEKLEQDPDIRVIILRGGGETFISGADLNEIKDNDVVESLDYYDFYAQSLYNDIADIRKPTIAMIDGYALGGGLELAVCCDLRVASEEAKFGLPEVNLGVFPAGGATQRLIDLIGVGNTKELIYTGRIIPASAAADMGLLNQTCPRERLEETTHELADQIAEKAPVAIRLAKQCINQHVSATGLEMEKIAGSLLYGTKDQKVGMQAFLENEEPEFKGI